MQSFGSVRVPHPAVATCTPKATTWEGPYALFSVLLVIAAGVATFAITAYTSKPGPAPRP